MIIRPTEALERLGKIKAPTAIAVVAYVAELEAANERLATLGRAVERERDELAEKSLEFMDGAGGYVPPMPIVAVDCLDAMGGRPRSPPFAPLAGTCAVCGSIPDEMCRRADPGEVCEFRAVAE